MDISQMVKESISYSEVARKLGYKYINGSVTREVKKIVAENNCDCSHFRKGLRCKYKTIERKCPVCGKEFKTKEGNKEERKTCSYSCSNKLFRSGPDNGNWKEHAYRSTCFHHHEKRCIICKEDKIVEVHHFDENKQNNDPGNLIPLCPTHHQYWHSRYKSLIEDKVSTYIQKFLTG
jgi:hypothetical protein